MFLLGHGVLGYGILSIHWDMAYSVLDQWVTEHRKLGRGASGIEHLGYRPLAMNGILENWVEVRYWLRH